MPRISVPNFVSIAVLVGSISSVAASRPLPDLQNLHASLVDWVLGLYSR